MFLSPLLLWFNKLPNMFGVKLHIFIDLLIIWIIKIVFPRTIVISVAFASSVLLSSYGKYKFSRSFSYWAFSNSANKEQKYI